LNANAQPLRQLSGYFPGGNGFLSGIVLLEGRMGIALGLLAVFCLTMLVLLPAVAACFFLAVEHFLRKARL